jgi:hypothetical protein
LLYSLGSANFALETELMNLKKYLDPDAQFFGEDKIRHTLGGLILAFGCLAIGLGWLAALLIVFIAGVSFEAGQLDTAINPEIILRDSRESPLGEVGFGFGLIDLAWDMLGALLMVLLNAVLF